jgi:hypothetical protein
VRMAEPETIHLSDQLKSATDKAEVAAKRYGTGIPMIGWSFFCRSDSSRGVKEFILEGLMNRTLFGPRVPAKLDACHL